jgi:hypothetical protein
MAFAYVNFLDGDVYLYAETSPMVYFKNDDVLFFASTDMIMKDGFGLDTKLTRNLKRNVVFRICKNRYPLPVAVIKRSYYTYYGNCYGGYGNEWDEYYGAQYGKGNKGAATNSGFVRQDNGNNKSEQSQPNANPVTPNEGP